ncbi:hypothetical protein HJG54_11575 [Leptolyngbya sp. NK1-12]|uniref:Uncharacterized protein n=1 Tax=Leptolyngbya sp. NK1-12 TaxID=2547451 RepID=A0AA97AGG6_9CYAN|nr:hypothetical protein [Leptolyngbya sp. NK1-12]WNZ23429.1 hypothetical protein HJG54_11575 [Leptolyngbya sp. NK1-12]
MQWQALWAILGIQEQCKFYNYDIAKFTPPAPARQEAGTENQGQTIYIIETFHANHSTLNLGGTVQGAQIINPPHKPDP